MDAGSVQHLDAAPPRFLHGRFEQPRLADPRFAVDQERAGTSRTNAEQKFTEQRAFLLSANEGSRADGRGLPVHHRSIVSARTVLRAQTTHPIQFSDRRHDSDGGVQASTLGGSTETARGAGIGRYQMTSKVLCPMCLSGPTTTVEVPDKVARKG